ncbi:asparagine synthase-related protein [Actinomyces sp. ZJ308]|uniref:asparagine synthase-related protein n=1 Tax=Actinomyces sp. ZJ308 TaxID=2708342 RepID=UPI0014220018|nr:asparagine synthase-related protein [Actinomyces sp. ZJ308]
MSVIEVELRLTSPQWQQTASSGDSTGSLWVRCDTPCPDPTDPEILVSHPGRLTAVRIKDDEVVLAQDRLRSWPLFWTLEDGADGGRRLVISDDATAMRDALSNPRLDPRARRELLDAGFVSGTDTLLVGVHQTEQGAIVRICGTTGRARTASYALARFSEESDMVVDPEEFSDLLLAALDAGMGRVLDDLAARPGSPRLVLPLSGGLDSRLLVAWLTLHGALDRAVAFTYGRPGTREVEVSRKVADAVGLEWHAVDYVPSDLREAWQTQDAADFLEYGYALGALPHVQDWYALRSLMASGVVRPGDVVLPGHTIVGNMHDEHLLEEPRVTRGQVARAILVHHQELQGDQRRAYADPYRAAKVRDFLDLWPFTGSPRDVQSILESYNVRERQTKYINNSMRAYEHLGLEWALPMLDVEFWSAWHRGAVELTATRDFYAVFIARLWARATALADGAGAGAVERTEDANLPYFAATEVSEETRSRLKTALSRLHLLGLAERTFSAWATLHSTMSFEAFITDTSLPSAAVQLMGGRKLLGFWTRAFLNDTWCRRCRLFTDLPVATPAELEAASGDSGTTV